MRKLVIDLDKAPADFEEWFGAELCGWMRNCDDCLRRNDVCNFTIGPEYWGGLPFVEVIEDG